jgi:hypothetical protein
MKNFPALLLLRGYLFPLLITAFFALAFFSGGRVFAVQNAGVSKITNEKLLVPEQPEWRQMLVSGGDGVVTVSGTLSAEKEGDNFCLLRYKFFDLSGQELSNTNASGKDELGQFLLLSMTKKEKKESFSMTLDIPANARVLWISFQEHHPVSRLYCENFSVVETGKTMEVTQTPVWFQKESGMGTKIKISGMLFYPDGEKVIKEKQALFRFVFEDANGQKIRNKAFPLSETVGEFRYLPTSMKENPFSFSLPVPNDVVRVKIGVQLFGRERPLLLKNLSIKEEFPHPKELLKENNLVLAGEWMENSAVLDNVIRVLSHENKDISLSDMTADPVGMEPVSNNVIVAAEFFREKSKTQVKLTSYPPLSLSELTKWKSPAHPSVMFKLRQYSLFWAVAMASYLSTEEAWPVERDILNSFFKEVPHGGSDAMVYNDHAVAMRLESFLIFLRGLDPVSGIPQIKGMRNLVVSDERFSKKLLAQILLDVHYLYYYINVNRQGGAFHNHNLFSANSLFLFAESFPELSISKIIRQKAEETIVFHAQLMYQPDGISSEQSSAYHNWNRGYFIRFGNYIKKSGARKELSNALSRKIEKWIEAETDLVFPNGEWVRMGDTPGVKVGDALKKLCKTDAASQNKKTRAYDPAKMSAGASAYPASGCYIFRSGFPDNAMLFIDISPQVFVHGHHDLGSWQLCEGDSLWVTEGGGPYDYSSPLYKKFVSSYSHNVAHPDDTLQKDGDAYNVKFDTHQTYWTLSFNTNVYEGYCHKRFFLVMKNLKGIYVEDVFSKSSGEKEINVESGIFLAPEVSASASNRHLELKNGGAKKFLLPVGENKALLTSEKICENTLKLRDTTKVTIQGKGRIAYFLLDDLSLEPQMRAIVDSEKKSIFFDK